jgi:hypothetical protein
MKHPQKCLEYMVVDTKSSTNLLQMAIRVEKVIHPVYASERTGMIWLLEKKSAPNGSRHQETMC